MWIVHFEKIASSAADSIGEHHEIDAAGVFGRGIFDPADVAGIVGELPQQLCRRMRRSHPAAGHFLGGAAQRGQRGRVGQVQQAIEGCRPR